MFGRIAFVLLAGLLAGACTSGDGLTSGEATDTLPLAEPLGRRLVPADGESPETDELAPSQISVETVAPPELPDPCAVDDLSFWTARVDVGDRSADAAVRIRNDGEEWCEVAIGASPQLDPRIEPDVWLEPGDWADLVVGQSGDTCDEPTPVTLAQIDVNGEPVVVPTAMVATCGWRLTALFANDRPEVACDPADLRVATTDTLLLVENYGFVSCTLGELAGPAPSEPADPPITALASGDVVAWEIGASTVTACGSDDLQLTLEFDDVTLATGPLDGCTAITGGPGRPFYGATDGPFADDLDLEATLAALDPSSG